MKKLFHLAITSALCLQSMSGVLSVSHARSAPPVPTLNPATGLPFATNYDVESGSEDVVMKFTRHSNAQYQLVGPDASRFILSDTGELRFVTAPQYVRPQDQGADNIYDITIKRVGSPTGLSGLDFGETTQDIQERGERGEDVQITDENGDVHTLQKGNREWRQLTMRELGNYVLSAIKEDGSIVVMGHSQFQAPAGTGFVKIYRGLGLALKDDGSLAGLVPGYNTNFIATGVVKAYRGGVLRSDGSIVSLRSSDAGMPTDTGYIKIYAAGGTSAATKADGSIVSWGTNSAGAPTGTGYVKIYTTSSAFAALKNDGSITARGNASYGGTGAPTGTGYVKIYPNGNAFAALKNDGSITARGNASYGGTGAPTGTGYVKIYSYSNNTFAALKSDGSVTSWGSTYGGTNNTEAPTDTGYIKIYANGGAFAALKSDGSISVRGNANYGGAGAPTGTGYVKIYPNGNAFAALKNDGSIAAWGDASYGGTGAPTDSGYVKVYANNRSFAALKSDGSVFSWGGGIVPYTDTNYAKIYTKRNSFVALKNDGSIAQRGQNEYDSYGDTINPPAPTDIGYQKLYSVGPINFAFKANDDLACWGVKYNNHTCPIQTSEESYTITVQPKYIPYTVEHYKQRENRTYPQMADSAQVMTGIDGVAVTGAIQAFSGYKYAGGYVAWGLSQVTSGTVQENTNRILKLYYRTDTAPRLAAHDTTIPRGQTLDPLSLVTSATDVEDGNLSGNVVVQNNGGLDTGTVGSYIVTYAVTDADQNTVTATATVSVVDTEFAATYTATGSQVFWKNDCTGGSVGGVLYQSSMTRTATGLTQESADLAAKQLAEQAVQQDITDHGQVYANVHGQCVSSCPVDSRITITTSAQPATTTNAKITVAGTVQGTVSTLTINGQTTAVNGGAFEREVTLIDGLNRIVIQATNDQGQLCQQEKTITITKQSTQTTTGNTNTSGSGGGSSSTGTVSGGSGGGSTGSRPSTSGGGSSGGGGSSSSSSSSSTSSSATSSETSTSVRSVGTNTTPPKTQPDTKTNQDTTQQKNKKETMHKAPQEKTLETVKEETKKFFCEMLIKEDKKAGYSYADVDYADFRMKDAKGGIYEKAVQSMYQHCLIHGMGNDITYYGIHQPLTYGAAYKFFARLLMLSYSEYEEEGQHRSLAYNLAGRAKNLWTRSGDKDPETAIDMKDFLDVFLRILDSIDKDRADIDTSAFEGKIIRRGEASFFMEKLIDKLYNGQ